MREPIDFAGAWLIEHADIPPELTLDQWRRQRGAERRAERERAHQANRARHRGRIQRLTGLAPLSRTAREVRHG